MSVTGESTKLSPLDSFYCMLFAAFYTGYDIPSTYSNGSVAHSHISLFDAVLGVIQDVTQEVGQRHMLECNWIIEQCELTKLAWTVSK